MREHKEESSSGEIPKYDLRKPKWGTVEQVSNKKPRISRKPKNYFKHLDSDQQEEAAQQSMTEGKLVNKSAKKNLQK
jgi:hypothetical protein